MTQYTKKTDFTREQPMYSSKVSPNRNLELFLFHVVWNAYCSL